MSSLRLILASLLHYGRMNLAVACGVAAGTAVLSGALLVGDSMRGSLRHLTLDRLGRIDQVLLTERFFREKLADEFAAAQPPAAQSAAVPAIILRTSLERTDPHRPGRANRVNLVGCDARFWQLGSGGPEHPPGPHEIVLNRPVAEQLGAAVGDVLLLHLPRPGLIPADSPLGRKRETVRSVRVTVSQIIAAEGLGRFGLRPTQQLPRNAYVPLDWLQERLDQPGRVNAILAAGPTDDAVARAAAEPWPPKTPVWLPSLADYGIAITQTPRGYLNVTSDRMLIEPAVEKAVLQAAHEQTVQPALTYLANTIACGPREIPYSTITAIDFQAEPPLGPFLTPEGKPIAPLGPNQIVLNSWAADDLGAKPGDTIRISYFEPESPHGEVREKTCELQLAAIAQLAGAADDRALTPAVPGVTDQLSMAEWDPPFPFDQRRIRKQDDQYWKKYGPTPKAFVSLATGRRLWASRFGQTTSIRICPKNGPQDGLTAESLQRAMLLDPAAMGFVFQPVKQQGLAASAGTTPFSILFLAFSSFIIAAAMMLVALLFALSIDRRATQVGILLAVGFTRRQIGRLMAGEGLLVAAGGSLLGVAAGVGYAALMLVGLRTWWLAAVVTPFLRLYVTPSSLAIGYASGVLVMFLAIAWTIRRMVRIAPRQLLAGQTAPQMPGIGGSGGARRRAWIEVALLLTSAAPVLALLVAPMDEAVRVGAFFGAGTLVLAASLTWMWLRLRAGATGPAVAVGRGNLLRMALRSASRRPGRSVLCVGLTAVAVFLIVAVSAFRLDPTQQVPTRQSGNGGFALVAQSDSPIYQNLDTPEGREQSGFTAQDLELLAHTSTVALRVRPGDDASCLNLYQPRQPRLLGVPQAMIDRGGFAWAEAPKDCPNPWQLLSQELGPAADGTPRIPVILEKNTANYSLHLWKGLGESYDVTDSGGRTVRLVIVALLADSIFQGDLLVAEKGLLQCFPEVSGYRFFLIEAPPADAPAVRAAWEQTLGNYGLATETTAARLAGFLAVQNTYLSTFQSLGGLGLLLGTVGLAAVQLRNVLERRGELALLRAAGFRRASLAQMVMFENSLLLLAGLLDGLLAALVAVLPHLLDHRVASLPWMSLAATLALVLAVGMLAGLIAVRAVLQAPLLPALREEHA
jgi:ABC-type lipoprotein release transport system permease subunit